MVIMACDRAVQFGARCRNDAVANGRCAEHQIGNVPRAPGPTVILVKPRLEGRVAETAFDLFRSVPRMEEDIEFSHGKLAQLTGLKSAGLKTCAASGTAVFRDQTVKNVSIAQLRSELIASCFALADVHIFQKANGATFLVLGHYKDGKAVSLRSDQRSFIDQLWTSYKHCSVWTNIPETVAVAGGTFFKFLTLEERGDQLLVQVTKPRMDESALISKTEIQNQKVEVLHVVEISWPGKPLFTLQYADGLWDMK